MTDPNFLQFPISCRFVGSVAFPDSRKKPSVFLTDSGGIELCWEDAAGHAVQVEFTRDGAEYFLGASEEEGSIAYSDIGHLSREQNPGSSPRQ